jgi:hypothetical protein
LTVVYKGIMIIFDRMVAMDYQRSVKWVDQSGNCRITYFGSCQFGKSNLCRV